MSWTFIYIEFDLSIHAFVVFDMYTMCISHLIHIHVHDFITCLSYTMFALVWGSFYSQSVPRTHFASIDYTRFFSHLGIMVVFYILLECVYYVSVK